MVKSVKGFKTADGRFYESEEEAKYQEYGYILSTIALDAVQFEGEDFTRFNDFIHANLEVVRDFCDAAIAYEKTYPKDADTESIEEFDDYSKRKEESVGDSKITVTSKD